MKNLHFDYCMEIRYSEDVGKCNYTIKCVPKDTERQKILNYNIEMTPESKPEWASDSLGNKYIFGCNQIPHSYFKYRIYGDVECGKKDYEETVTENDAMIYRHSHGLTLPGDTIKKYLEDAKKGNKDYDSFSPLEKAKYLSGLLHKDFRYEKGNTEISTCAEKALSLGKGVCQDYAHILISLLNLSGCSARYVTGLIMGEGASHAWVEVASDGRWYGIDPTNDVMVDDSHIKIGVGRDATECQLNRGIMHGGGDQTQIINVSVTEISEGRKFIMKGGWL